MMGCIIFFAFPSAFFAEDQRVSPQTEEIRAIYLGRSFLSEKKVSEVLDLVSRTELNAVVINTKDDGKNNDGEVLAGDKSRQMIARFRAQGIYVICRMPVFHDTMYANAYPAAAVKSRKTGRLWADSLGWVWIDPTAEEYRKYFLSIVSQSVKAGCDEINIDYVRFPSSIDGNLNDAVYPFWRKEAMSQCGVVREFLVALRQHLTLRYPRTKLSADVFGYTFLAGGQPGIGQCIEDFAANVDYIAPMSYPCLYWCYDKNFNVPDPSFVPYAVQKVTLEKGLQYLRSRGFETKVRPWIQAFDRYNFCRVTKKGCPKGCGEVKVHYGRENIQLQIRASMDLHDNAVKGFMMWNSAAFYPENIFEPK